MFEISDLDRAFWKKIGGFFKDFFLSNYEGAEFLGYGEQDYRFYLDFLFDRYFKKEELEEVQMNFEEYLKKKGVRAFLEIQGIGALTLSEGNGIRIFLVAFESEERFKLYNVWLERIKEYDHRIISERLDLFSFPDFAGIGLVLYHPRGFVLRRELIEFMREVNDSLGYEEVYTPHYFKSLLWKRSGHYEAYLDKMIIFNKEGEEYAVKPMNCPGHILIYKTKLRSYKEMPIKFAEFGNVYRWEKSGELHGIFRPRGFTQDDGHAFLREDQLKDEIIRLLKKVVEIYKVFGIENYRIFLSTMPEKHIGSIELWEKATNYLKKGLEEAGFEYEIKEGEGAFYGPKIDIDIQDSLGRWWQCTTFQVDFMMPERFDVFYIDRDNRKKRVVMVHRALLGSIERFLGVLIEHYGGKFPTWLSPIQVSVIPIKEENEKYAKEVYELLKKEKIRVKYLSPEQSLEKRIKLSYKESVPYIVIVGKKEEEKKTVSIRARGNKSGELMLEKFLEELKKEIHERRLNPSIV